MDLDGICHGDWQKTLDDGTFLYLFGTQHTQFESGLAVSGLAVFLFLVSQLLSFFKPAWDTFQNWLAGVRHPDCVLQRPRTYSVNCLQGCMLLSLAESTCAYRGSNKREEADDSVEVFKSRSFLRCGWDERSIFDSGDTVKSSAWGTC